MADVAVQPIRRLLIANRGEIARRIQRTAHEMGIDTVAVYADSDVSAPFVREADIAIALNGNLPGESYLDASKVLEACSRSGADAVHPGYGFLSENADFARSVVQAGLRWIGPTGEAIAAVGDKLAAKALMRELGVPTLPAIQVDDDTDLAAAAIEIGFPLLVKAAAGGGGRGMRIVQAGEDIAEAVSSARREARSALGDATVFLERWLTKPRHVEVQILGDSHGNLVHLFERECSIQRRHQKIIEESPSPAVDSALRARMGKAALTVARKIGYTSAGTVEFLLDGGDFWFLEVNTRLQVEHPVTEAVTGLDIVREQIRIVEGEPLGYSQEDLSLRGHAIEARLYAEDPVNDFLPAGGTVLEWRPDNGSGARFDSGIEPGSEISVNFDPMIAKVIAAAPSRREAASRLARTLERTRLQGVANNRDFLVAALRASAFLSGDTTTDFIERVDPGRKRVLTTTDAHDALIAATIHGQGRRRAKAAVLRNVPTGWRNSLMPPQTSRFRIDGVETRVDYRPRRDGAFDVSIGETSHVVRVFRQKTDGVDIEIDGRRCFAAIRQHESHWLLHGPGGDMDIVEVPRFPSGALATVTGGLVAPMPGNVTSVRVATGDSVSRGQLLLTLEAMKMEHRIIAEKSGRVSRILVQQGDQVDNGALLAVLEEDEQ